MPTVGNYVYAGSAELKEILQDKYAVLSLEDPMFSDIMPIVSVAADRVFVDQRDSFRGLLNARGVGGQYGVVQREGISRYEYRPGYYGDKKEMDEQMLTQSAQIGTWGQKINLTYAQANDQDHLMTRTLQRLKWIGWTMVTTGKYSCFDQNGNLIVSDQSSMVTFQTATAWSNHSAATPLFDIRQAKLRHRGHSVSFGKDAKLYLNSQDVNDLLSNTNTADLGGFRSIVLGSAAAQSIGMTLDAVNSFLLRNDLPQIVEWDDNYIDDNGATQMYIPYQSGTLIGKRMKGEPVAEFYMTVNPELMYDDNGGVRAAMDGRRLDDPLANLFYDFEIKRKPIRAESAMGFNGCPGVLYPSAVIPFNTSGGGSDS